MESSRNKLLRQLFDRAPPHVVRLTLQQTLRPVDQLQISIALPARNTFPLELDIGAKALSSSRGQNRADQRFWIIVR
jgi:hypothetical protein